MKRKEKQNRINFESIFKPLIAVITVVMAFYIFNKIITGQIEQSNRDITLYLLGVLSGILTLILNYYFGSSHSSNQKTEIMKNTTPVKETSDEYCKYSKK